MTADQEFDVIVVGAGAAGYAAALAAHQRGAKTLIIEKCPEATAGGSTRVSGGGWFVNRNVEQAKTYLRSLCGVYTLPDDVIDAWAKETANNSEWLRGFGATVATSSEHHTVPEYPELDGSDCYGGMDVINGQLGNFSLYDFLTAAIANHNIAIRFCCPAVELIQQQGCGSITGVVVEYKGQRQSLMARGGVILATGGFEADDEMVRNYLGLADRVLWGSEANTGDGQRMAQKAGADLWHM